MNDLEWLARNVHEWNDDFVFVNIAKTSMIELPEFVSRFSNKCCDGCGCYTKTQWLAKRAELVLVNNTVATPQWNGEGLPPVGCEVSQAAWSKNPMRVVYVCEEAREACLLADDGLYVCSIDELEALNPERDRELKELESIFSEIFGKSLTIQEKALFIYNQGYRKTS